MASSKCWQCGKALQKHPKTGELIFRELDMPMGTITVRVHKICYDDARLVVYPNTPTEPVEGRAWSSE